MLGVSKIRDRRICIYSRPLSQGAKTSSKEVGSGNPTPYMSSYAYLIRCMCLNLRLQFVVAVFVLRPKRDSLMNYWKKSNTINTTKTYTHTSANYLSKHKKSSNPPKTYKKLIQSPGVLSMPDFFLGAKWPESIVSNVHPRTRSQQPGSRDHPI